MVKDWIKTHLGLLSILPVYLFLRAHTDLVYDGGDLRGFFVTLLDPAGPYISVIYRAVLIGTIGYFPIVAIAALLDRHATITSALILAGLPIVMSVYNCGLILPSFACVALVMMAAISASLYFALNSLKTRLLSVLLRRSAAAY